MLQCLARLGPQGPAQGIHRVGSFEGDQGDLVLDIHEQHAVSPGVLALVRRGGDRLRRKPSGGERSSSQATHLYDNRAVKRAGLLGELMPSIHSISENERMTSKRDMKNSFSFCHCIFTFYVLPAMGI